jgi:hypothetical protein
MMTRVGRAVKLPETYQRLWRPGLNVIASETAGWRRDTKVGSNQSWHTTLDAVPERGQRNAPVAERGMPVSSDDLLS